MAIDDGRFSIPMRLLLTHTQRDPLLRWCRAEDRDPAEIVSAIVGAALDSRSDLYQPADESQAGEDQGESLRRHLRRLRVAARRQGDDSPAWLDGYIRDLEQELRDP
jgi:hypothetical protein